jgi:hypothetical protein
MTQQDVGKSGKGEVRWGRGLQPGPCDINKTMIDLENPYG